MKVNAGTNLYGWTHLEDRSVLGLAERPRRREWEAEYISEYCSQTFRGELTIYHCRLGSWPQPLTAPELSAEEMAMLKVRMRWADAVVILADKIIVVEGKLRASEFLKGLGELQLYVHLVRHTPEFLKFRDRQAVGRLVIPLDDPAVSLMARQNNIEVAVFKPTFYPEYLEVIQARQARPIRPEEATLLGGE